MVEYQLISLWKVEVGWTIADVRMSADGQYLLIKGDDRIAYYNWVPRLLWQGKAQGEARSALRHVAVSSNRGQVLAASDSMVCSFNSEGELLSYASIDKDRTVQALHLDTTTNCIAASDGKAVSYLDRNGKPKWQHNLRKTVRSVTISSDGEWILAGGEDSKVTCLDRNGQEVWTSQLDKQIISISAGRDVIAVGDVGNVVHCLDTEGRELCHCEVRGQLKGVAVSTAGRYVAVGTESELYQLFFNDLPIFIRPVHSERAGARDALGQLGTRNIQNIFMNHDGGCLLVEGTEDLWCYDLEGTLLWGCANINLIGIQKTAETQELERKKERAAELAAPLAAQMAAPLAAQLATQLVASQDAQMAAQLATQRAEQQATELAEHRAQELVAKLGLAPEQAARQAAKQAAQQAARQAAQQAVRLVAQEKVRKIREAFTKHTYSQSSTKTREAKARQNIRLEGEILDLYFDGKGYLFVLAVDLDTVRRAVKLAKRTNIYIIAYNASKDVVQMVKRTRGVDLYRLSDMTKTTGMFGGSDFEPFMLAQGKMFTKK